MLPCSVHIHMCTPYNWDPNIRNLKKKEEANYYLINIGGEAGVGWGRGMQPTKPPKFLYLLIILLGQHKIGLAKYSV